MVQVCHGLLSWSVIEGSVGYSCHLLFDIPVQVSVGKECFSFSAMMRRDVGVVSYGSCEVLFGSALLSYTVFIPQLPEWLKGF